MVGYGSTDARFALDAQKFAQRMERLLWGIRRQATSESGCRTEFHVLQTGSQGYFGLFLMPSCVDDIERKGFV